MVNINARVYMCAPTNITLLSLLCPCAMCSLRACESAARVFSAKQQPLLRPISNDAKRRALALPPGNVLEELFGAPDA